MSRHRVLIADPIGAAGLAMLEDAGAEVVQRTGGDREELLAALPGVEALLVRSRTRVDRELLAAAPELRVVGRAGNGVDNVDLEAATERGVLVVNAPTGNVSAAVEHTFALLLALSRHLAAANHDLREGRWQPHRFVGSELRGKRLGVVGLGRIGQRVATTARAGFGMEVVAHDPFLDAAVARRLDVELVELEELLASSQVVSLHVPLTERTRGLLDVERLALLPEGALLVNCARGGVVDEEALLTALDAERLGGAALDVFAEEPPRNLDLVRHPRVVATPHLGAQTREARERTSQEVARMVLDALDGSLAVTAVNLPFRCERPADEPYLRLGEQLGKLASALAEGSFRCVSVTFEGVPEELHRAVTMAVARGALIAVQGDSVSYVSVELGLERRGLELISRRRRGSGDYPFLVEVELSGGGETVGLAGSVFEDHEPRVVRFGNTPLEFRPHGRLLIVRTADVTGVLGRVGTILGEEGINIADAHLSRRDGESDAWTVLRLDQTPPRRVFRRLGELPEMRRSLVADLGGGAAQSSSPAAARHDLVRA